MITSFFKPKGDGAATADAGRAAPAAKGEATSSARAEPKLEETPTSSGGSNDRDETHQGARPPSRCSSSSSSSMRACACVRAADLSPTTSDAGRKRLRKAVIDDASDEEAEAPLPASGEAAAEPSAEAPAHTPLPDRSTADPEEMADAPEEEAAEEGGASADVADTDAAPAPAATKPAASLQLRQAPKAAPKASAKAGSAGSKTAIPYHKYDPPAAATWKPGEPVPYAYVAEVFGQIEAESKRLAITELMANAFRTVIATSPSELLPVVCLATNKIAAEYEGVELGIGDSIMMRAVAETCGRSVDAIKSQLEAEGDLGAVALASRKKQVKSHRMCHGDHVAAA